MITALRVVLIIAVIFFIAALVFSFIIKRRGGK